MARTGLKSLSLKAVGFAGLLVFVLAWGLAPSKAWAAPSLILLEDNGEGNPAYRKVIEGLGAVIVSNNLGKIYDHIDVLTDSRATRSGLFEQIRKRGIKSDVDVVILSHGDDKRLLLGTGDITDQDLRAAGPFPRLRLVYMMGCYSASLGDAWRAAGARAVVGHQDVNSLPGFFFPRLLRRWAEGASIRDAVEDAYRFSEGTALLLSSYIKESELLNTVGVVRSEPVIAGANIDRYGHVHSDHSSLMIASILDKNATAKLAQDRKNHFNHGAFETTAISLLGGMIPQATLDVDAIPSAQTLVGKLGKVAWDQMLDSFPDAGMGLSIDEGQEIWLDGESLRFMLVSVRDFGGGKLSAVLDRLQGVRLTRTADKLNIAIYFNESFTVVLEDQAKAETFSPYEVYVPRTFRFSLTMKDGVLALNGLDQGQGQDDALHLKLKMPVVSDVVYVRKALANLTDGKVRVEAGVLGNLVTVVASGEISTRKLTGVDVWETISRNATLLSWSTLLFH